MLTSSKPLFAFFAIWLSATSAVACPFCSAVSQTFSEEIQSMDAAVICQLEKIGVFRADDNANPQAEVPRSTFVITKVIKGNQFVSVGDTFKCVYFGEAKKQRPFLATATDAPHLQWSTPLILTDRAENYLGLLEKLNNSGKARQLTELTAQRKQLRSKQLGNQQLDNAPDSVALEQSSPELTALNAKISALESELSVGRLEFFQNYLEDEDEMLARDAYDEFAKAPYAAVQALKPKMDHGKLIAFLNDTDVPSNRRRLYFTMLGVCGTPDDAAMLEQFMLSDDRKKKAGLDAMLACYLLLTAEEGLVKVEEAFFRNTDAEYADTYAAIMAIRFHGSEVDVLSRKRLTKSLHYMLDRPDLADLVIPDLAKWEDWSVMGKLVDLFVTADENSSWVRVPVINYLRACPLPIAKEKIEFLKTIDADAVKRAMTFFPVAPEKKTEEQQTGDESAKAQEAAPADATGAVTPSSDARGKVAQDFKPLRIDESTRNIASIHTAKVNVAQVGTTQPSTELPFKDAAVEPGSVAIKKTKSVVSITPPDTLHQAESMAEQGPNFWNLLGVTMASVAVCFYAMRSALGMQS